MNWVTGDAIIQDREYIRSLSEEIMILFWYINFYQEGNLGLNTESRGLEGKKQKVWR